MMKQIFYRLTCGMVLTASALSVTASAPYAAKQPFSPEGRHHGAMVERTGVRQDRPAVPVQHPGGNSSSIFDFSAAPARPAVSNPLLAPRRTQTPPNLRACVVSSHRIEIGKGMYSVPTSPSASFELIKIGMSSNYSSVYADGKYYTVSYENWGPGMEFVYIDVYDTETWQIIEYKDGNLGSLAFDTTWDPSTGRIYGCFWNDDMSDVILGYTDYSADQITTTEICPAEKIYYGIAADSDGSLYGIAGNGDFYSIDPATGKAELIAETGLASKYMTTATIDHRTGRLFYAVCNDDFGGLYEIDKTTGATTLMTEFEGGEALNGMYAAKPLAEDGAPYMATELKVDFDGASLSGNICFQAPSVYFCGDPAEGEVSYKIIARDEVIAEGTTEYGKYTEAPVTVPEAGQYEFTVILCNEEGESPASSVSAFVGPDVPKATYVTAVYNDGTFDISWTPVSESVNGGFIDTGNMKYTVTRYPGGVVVADRIAETSCTDNVGEVKDLCAIYYTVVADDGYSVSSEARSASTVLGTVTPPYKESFGSEESMQFFTILDVNADGKQWMWDYREAAKLPFSGMYDADDWLITPMINMEAGKSYILNFRIFGGDSTWIERFEVKYGKSATAEGMTETLIEPTEVAANQANPMDCEVVITPSESGLFCIGFHGISDADRFNLYLDEIRLSAGLAKDAPAVVSDFAVVPESYTSLSATVSLKAPYMNISGQELSGLMSVSVSRDGEVIKTFSNVAPGESLSMTDTEIPIGWHTWSAVAANNSGEGPVVETRTLIGQDYAKPATDVKAIEGPTYGEVTVSWTAPTENINGDLISADDVKYNLYLRGDYDNPIAVGLSETSYSYRAYPEDSDQHFMQYIVSTVTDAGENFDGVPSMAIPVGKPHDCPYIESFPEKGASHPLAIMSDNPDSRWGVYDGTSFNNMSGIPIEPYDHDDGMAVIFGANTGYYADLFTAKIAIPEVNPELTFFVYPLGIDDANEIKVFANYDGEEHEVAAVQINTTGAINNWNRVAIPLDELAGKVVYLKFRGTVYNFSRSFMDLIKVGTRPDNDLAITSIIAPSSVSPSQEFNFIVNIANYGAKAATVYDVDIYCNGEIIATASGDAIQPSETFVLEIPYCFNSLSSASNVVYAQLIAEGDNENDNDTSGKISIRLRQNPYPPVSDLSGIYSDDGVALAWTEPDMNNILELPLTDDFETADDWATESGDWTFVDQDGGIIGSFDTAPVPGFSPFESTSQYFVFNSNGANWNITFDAHSGTKYLAVIYNYDGVCNDDWAISPRLSGKAQTVSFFARSYYRLYPESFEVLYTTEEVDGENFDADKFTSLLTVNSAADSWTEYKVDLPEGARNFAIRCTSNDAMLFMLDDVTYIPYVGADKLAHMGYNVYRDGEKLNIGCVEEPEFLDPSVKEAGHTYSVTAVYDLGESSPVSLKVDTNSVAGAGIDALGIYAADSAIVVTNAADALITVSASDGKVLYCADGSARTIIPVEPGIYVVKAGATVKKVNVR